MGSCRLARRAGSHAAAMAHAISTSSDPPNDTGSTGGTP